jgi:hypothetical protein
MTMVAVGAFGTVGIYRRAVHFVPNLFRDTGFVRQTSLLAHLGGCLSRLPARDLPLTHRIRLHVIFFFHFGLLSFLRIMLRRFDNSCCPILNNPKKNFLSGPEAYTWAKDLAFLGRITTKGSVVSKPFGRTQGKLRESSWAS